MNTKKSSSLTVRYAYIQGLYWMSFAAVMSFSSIYLLDAGFTNTQIGLLIAAAGIVSAVLQPLVASYADKSRSPSLKKIVLAADLLLLVCSGTLLALHHRSPALTGFFFGSSVLLLQLLTPLVNSLGTESLNQGKSLNFGVSRGMGSVAYAVAAYALGRINAKTGPGSIPVSMLLIYACFTLALFAFPFAKADRRQKTGAKKEGAGPLEFFVRYKRFSVLLIGCILLYISHVLINNFCFQITLAKGGQSAEMGFSMALASILELPTMFCFARMVQKIRCDIWLRISGVFLMLKALGTLLAPGIPSFYAVQALQMGGWALITVSSVYYVNAVMEEQDAIKGQAYFTMTYTIGSVLASLIGGSLIDRAGVTAMLVFASACAVVGMLIMLFAAQRAD